MNKHLACILAGMILLSSCVICLATTTGGLPMPVYSLISPSAFDERTSTPADNAPIARAQAAQLSEIKALLAALRADEITTLLLTGAHLRSDVNIPLTAEDTKQVLTLLQAMELTLLSPAEYDAERANPATGGGSAVFIQQGDLRIKVTHGSFFTISYGDGTKSYMFANGYVALDDFVSSICYLDESATAVCSIVPASGLIKAAPVSSARFAKEQDFAVYRRRVAALDVRRITKIQYTPFLYEGAVRGVNPADMQVLLYALQDTDKLAVFPTPQNPATGGLDCVYMEYDGEPLLLSWDGYWLVVQYADWHYPLIFDISEVPMWQKVRDALNPAFDSEPILEGGSNS